MQAHTLACLRGQASGSSPRGGVHREGACGPRAAQAGSPRGALEGGPRPGWRPGALSQRSPGGVSCEREPTLKRRSSASLAGRYPAPGGAGSLSSGLRARDQGSPPLHGLERAWLAWHWACKPCPVLQRVAQPGHTGPDLRQQIGGACSLAHGLAAILLWPVMHTLFLIQEHARVNPPYHSVLVLLNRSIMYSEQRAAGARLSASTTSLAVGRSAGSYSRQRCIRRSTAGGHSSGTLRGRQRSNHPQPAALCHAQQLRQSSPNCND